MLRRLAVLILLTLLGGSLVYGQALPTPAAHWGGMMFPRLTPKKEIGLHFVLFTEFGKELGSDSLFLFESYNGVYDPEKGEHSGINETLGFNLLAYARTKYFRGNRARLRSNITQRTVASVGLVADHVTEYLQNDFMHRGCWAIAGDIDNIPRDPELDGSEDAREEEGTSLGPTKKMPVVIYGREYNLQFRSRQLVGTGIEYIPTPFFVGAGLAVGTLNQEMYIHTGAIPYVFDLEKLDSAFLRGLIGADRATGVQGLGIGTMVRTGVLLPGYHLNDLTAAYFNVQGHVRLHLSVSDYPLYLELGLTYAQGFFGRAIETPAELRARGIKHHPRKVYHNKSPIHERFFTVKLEIGRFVFETYNDKVGQKDKGPTMGARVTWVFDRFWWES